METKLLSLKEAAEVLKIGVRTLEKLCREGKMPGAIRIGRQWRIDFDALMGQVKQV